jgi:multidrug efflux pump subunit AcrA (membrane-fusion protein)
MESQESAKRPGPLVEAEPPPPRRAVFIVTASVAALILALLGWTLRDVLRPMHEVAVVQAVFGRQSESPAASDQSPEGRFESVRARPTVQAPGWLEADPFYTACSALADGVIESIDVLEGERVEAGQVVARLVAEDAQIALRRAEADLAAAEAALDSRWRSATRPLGTGRSRSSSSGPSRRVAQRWRRARQTSGCSRRGSRPPPPC